MKKRLHHDMYTAFVATLLLFLSFLYSVNRVFAQENSLELSVIQQIRVNAPYPKPKEGVRYRLEAQDEAPLPEGAKGVYEFTIFGENTYTLRYQNLPKGTYHYKLYQLPKGESSLLVADSRSYYIQLEVFQSTEEMVIRPSMMDEQYHKLESLTFVNEMKVIEEEDVGLQTTGRRIGELPFTGVEDYLNNWLVLLPLLLLLLLFRRKENNDEGYIKQFDDSFK